MAQRTISTPSSKDILKRVMSLCVIGKTSPFLAFAIKKGMTEPLDPITLPYLTAENRRSLFPFILFAAIKSLSETNLVAPYKLIGAAALSVDNATTTFTLVARAPSITF